MRVGALPSLAAYHAGTWAMTALLRKYNTSLLTFGIYIALAAFAVACSIGVF